LDLLADSCDRGNEISRYEQGGKFTLWETVCFSRKTWFYGVNLHGVLGLAARITTQWLTTYFSFMFFFPYIFHM
jgi:hypothetical protein